jgi:hypothetical protein
MDIDRMLVPATPVREAARAAGLLTYNTGLACRHGHLCDRYVANAECIECKADANAAQKAKREARKAATIAGQAEPAAEPQAAPAPAPEVEAQVITPPWDEPAPSNAVTLRARAEQIAADDPPAEPWDGGPPKDRDRRALDRKIDRALAKNTMLAKYSRYELGRMIERSADPYVPDRPAESEPPATPAELAWYDRHQWVLLDNVWMDPLLAMVELARRDAVADAAARREALHDAQ